MDYSKMSDDDLRAELGKRSLNTSGDTATMVARLQEDDAKKQAAASGGGSNDGNSDEAESLSGYEGTPEDADRSKQHPGAGDPKVKEGTTSWEDPSKRGEDIGFVSTADTKPGTTNAVDKDNPHVPATPSS